MMHTRTSPQLDRKEPAQSGGLFSTRLLNALPYTNTVKDIYLRTKQKNEAARIALSLAEKAATTAITPFTSKYGFVDKLAGEQWEKLDEKYGDNNLAKVVHSVTYPIAFSYGLAGYARNKMLGLASPVLQVSNEWADVIVDNLMPPETDETIEEEYRKMQHRVRGPMDKIVDRTSVHSLIRLPANAFKFSINSFSSGTYLTIGFTEMSMARMWNSMTILVNSINTVFDEVLQHPWSASNNIDVSKLYQASVIFGARFVNAYVEDLEKMSVDLKNYLEDHNLQYNAKIVELISKRIGMIESRLLQLGGSFNESKSEVKSEETSKPFSHRPRYLMYTQRKVVDPSERMPSMLLGEGEHPVDQHLLDIEASRRPTLMAASPIHTHSHKAETEHKVDAEIPLKRKHKNKKAKTAKPAPVVAEPEPVKRVVEEETVVDPDVDEHGFKLVKPKAHDHLLPQSVAQQMGKDLLTKHDNKHLPVTPTNSPADFHTESSPAVAASEALVNNNPYSAIGLDEGKIVPGPARQVNEKEEIAHQKNVYKHTLSNMMHVVAERLEDDEAAQRAERHAELPAWESAKHPVHVAHEEPAPAPKVDEIPAAAAQNNPFEKLAELDANVDPLSLGMSSM